MPGLVNRTPADDPLRGLAENVDLQGFLRIVWAARARSWTRTRSASAPSWAPWNALAGVTTTLDMAFHHGSRSRGAVATGARHVGPRVLRRTRPDGLAWAQRLDALAAWPDACAPSAVRRSRGRRDAALDLHLFPDHLAEVCRVLTSQRTDRRLVHVHASGTPPRTPMSPPAWVPTRSRRCRPARRGTERPRARRPPQRRGSCPRRRRRCKRRPLPGSNLKLASGRCVDHRGDRTASVWATREHGCSSCVTFGFWQTMRQTALLARLTSADLDCGPAVDIGIRAATIDGAWALGRPHRQPRGGRRADLILDPTRRTSR